MKRFLTLSIMAMAAFSCAKENVTTQDGDLQSLGMSISMSDVKSGRAIIDTEATPADLGVVLMKVFDPANAEVATVNPIKDGLLTNILKTIVNSPINSSDRIVVEKIKSTASYVRIMGYYDAAAVWEELSAIDAKDVNAIQGYEFNKVPFVSTATDGKDDITKGAGMGTGGHASHKVWTVEATIKPYFAHIQMKGKPTVTGATITLDNVFLNALNKNKADQDVTTYEGNHAVWEYDADGKIIGSKIPGTSTVGGWEADYATNFGQMTNGDHTDKYSAFHLWPATERPHVILEVTVTPDDGSPSYKGYITITNLTDVGGGTTVEAGKIYNVDLGSLTITLGDITPDPESKPADLYLKVTVENWEKVDLKPEL